MYIETLLLSNYNKLVLRCDFDKEYSIPGNATNWNWQVMPDFGLCIVF